MNNNRGILLVVSGPSGVGKGTVISKLFEMDENLYFSVSATTRKPRPGETDGVSYNFKTREQFEEEIDNGEMLEYAMYSGNYYGTPKSAVERKLAQGKDVVLDIEINGARSVSRLMPEAVLVYILPPDMAELRRRLEGRNTETEEMIKLRLETAYHELREAPEMYDFFVVNDVVESAASKIEYILEAKRCSRIAMQKALKQILEEVNNLA